MEHIVKSVLGNLNAIIPLLADVINNMNNDDALMQLKFGLYDGWLLFGKALQIHDQTADFKDIRTTLIQLIYDAEDMVDEQNALVRQENMASQLGQAVSRSLGWSKNDAKKLLNNLKVSFDHCKIILEGLIKENQIQMPTTSRSSDLDSDQRRRVAYFSLFPRDYQFNLDYLVHLWVGECFVQIDRIMPILEKIKEKRVQELIEKSILMIDPLEDSKYKLNDSDRPFAELAAADTCLHLDQGLSSLRFLDKNIRHLSLLCDFDSRIWRRLKSCKPKLRTFLPLQEDNTFVLEELPMTVLESLLRLRVLSLRYTGVQKLPAFLRKLKHLRYLDISFTKVGKLPSKLHENNHALQILKILGTQNHLFNFPKDFTELTNLIYVDWDENFLRKCTRPCYVGKLSLLENLPLFQIGEADGYRISELKGMNFLQGSICIENLHHVNDEKEAKDAGLDLKCGLTKIELKWKEGSIEGCAYDEVLTGLRPHENVRELKITYYRGNNLPGWISDCNLMIKKVHLMECSSCYFPALGKMKNLKTLVLENMESISQVSCRSDDDTDPEVVRFPSLESMELHNMTQLQAWTGLLENDRPLVGQIKVDGCHPLCNNGIRDAFPRALIIEA